MIQEYSIFDIGFDKYLSRGTSVLEAGNALYNLPMPSILGSGFYEIPPGQIGSGELVGNITMVTGLLQSYNYVSGSAGWQINYDGEVEFSSGVFRGTLSAASGTLGSITIGTNAWHMDSYGNMWWGTYANFAAALDKMSAGGVWGRLRVTRTTAGTGYSYTNTTNNVENVGLDIEMGHGLVLTNTLPAIRVDMGGVGNIFSGRISNTGKGISISRMAGPGTANLLSLTSANSTGGTMADITRDGTGVITALNIDHITSSSSINTGIIMSLSSGNSAICYAFRFNGSEIVSSAIGGSQNKKIRISIAGTDYYIPLHTA